MGRETQRSTFFVVLAAIMLAVNLIGFIESYFQPLLNSEAAMPLVLHLHAAIGFSLFALFLVQSILAFRGNLAAHRKIGPIVALASLVLLIAGLGMIRLSAEGYVENPAESQVVPMLIQASAVWVSIFVELAFAMFMGLAILLRRNSDAHKRLVFLAFVGISSPALTRMCQFLLPDLSPAVFTLSSMLLLVIALAAYDVKRRRRVHVITVLGGAFQVVGLTLFAAVLPYTPLGQRVILALS